MNPLIEKFEEVYGKKPNEGGLIDELAKQDEPSTAYIGTGIMGGMGNDVISLGGDTMLNSPYISNGITCTNANTFTSNTKSFCLPNQTSVEQQFNKVLEDVAHSRATVAGISAEIDQSFTGFGGQIRYTVEIIGRYP